MQTDTVWVVLVIQIAWVAELSEIKFCKVLNKAIYILPSMNLTAASVGNSVYIFYLIYLALLNLFNLALLRFLLNLPSLYILGKKPISF